MDYKNLRIQWAPSVTQASGKRFHCGHCSADAGVISELGGAQAFRANGQGTNKFAAILFCPVCSQPTYIDPDGTLFPATPLGAEK